MYVIIPLVDVGFSSRFFLFLETIPSVDVGFLQDLFSYWRLYHKKKGIKKKEK